MKLTARLLAFLLVAFVAPPVGAQEMISVTLDSPDPFLPAWGEVKVEAVVAASEEILRVAFYVDGMLMGELAEPPYDLSFDIGENVDAHRFEVVAYGASGATGTTSLTTPSLRVNEELRISLQQLYVTVTDRDGTRLQNLGRQDFDILDEGNRQEIVTFTRGDVPFTALVLVDASLSMAGEKLEAALLGAKTFFDGMRTLDEGRLLVFSDRILHTTPFTTFPDVLSAGLGGIEARGGTALNDHLYLALKQLEQRQGRRVVLLLSDGVDSHSVLEMAQVLEVAHRSQALVYWLRLPYGRRKVTPDLSTPWRDMHGYRRERELLEQTVSESGGRIQTLASTLEIAPAFTDILEELREQYVLGYYPAVARHDKSWRQVRVKARGTRLAVRCREGYFDF
jgi:Ca-activated chloride channel family protein